MSQEQHGNSEILTFWGKNLQPAHCPRCNVAHLISVERESITCPSCYKADLEYQPTIIRSEPPELMLEFSISPIQIKDRLREWLKNFWLHPKDLNPDILIQRLNRTFIPLWLIDGNVFGNWQAQMGFEYQVASSQEIYKSGYWTTRKLTETRIRWEPRIGTVDRDYQNITIPALEEHERMMRGLGKFNLKVALNYSPMKLGHASIRVPNLVPDTVWPEAKSAFNHLVSADCQIASDAQHVDEFNISAVYKNQKWTLLLLPVYSTFYRDEDYNIYPILIHGQTGRIFGIKRASVKQARTWSISLTVITLFSFFVGLLFAASTIILPIMAVISVLFFAFSLVVGILAPIPAIWAWNSNRSQELE